jgi:hypothetical protein
MQPVTPGLRGVLAAAVLIAASCATHTAAKPPPAPGCSARFVADEASGAVAPSMPRDVFDAVAIDATGVTVSTTCGSVVSRPRRTRKGWKFRARWRPCGSARKAVLVATVDPRCQALRGVLKTRKPRARLELRVNATVPCDESVAFESTFQGI